MTYTNAKRKYADESIGRSKSTPERDPLLCIANHCPLKGTVAPGVTGQTSRYYCHCHAYANADKWPAITEGLNQNIWLVEFCRDIYALPHKQDWREFALQFWAGMDEHMLPLEHEDLPAYWARCTEELEFRVGARHKRPQPRKPLERKPGRGGNLALPALKRRRT